MRAIFIELNSLHRGVEVPDFYAPPSPHVPEADGVVCGAGGEEGGGRVDIDGPEGALVAVVGAEAFAVSGVPGADYLVLRAGEEDVAIFGVSLMDLSQGFLVGM